MKYGLLKYMKYHIKCKTYHYLSKNSASGKSKPSDCTTRCPL